MVRNIALLTGGDSSEWQIALQGAENIGNALDRSRYTPYTIVLRNGHWTYTAPEQKANSTATTLPCPWPAGKSNSTMP